MQLTFSTLSLWYLWTVFMHRIIALSVSLLFRLRTSNFLGYWQLLEINYDQSLYYTNTGSFLLKKYILELLKEKKKKASKATSKLSSSLRPSWQTWRFNYSKHLGKPGSSARGCGVFTEPSGAQILTFYLDCNGLKTTECLCRSVVPNGRHCSRSGSRRPGGENPFNRRTKGKGTGNNGAFCQSFIPPHVR